MKFLYYIGLCLLSTSLFATEIPTWLRRTPNDDTQYFYFVGRGSSKSENVAFDEARASAQASAVRRLFGVTIKLDTRSLETLERSSLVKQQAEVSQTIQLKEFVEQESYVEKGEQTTVSVLYKYPRSAFDEEKRRLSTINENVEISLITVDDLSTPNQRASFKPTTTRVKDLAFYHQATPWVLYLLEVEYGSSTVSYGPGLLSLGGAIERRIGIIGIKLGGAYLFNKADATNSNSYAASGFNIFAGVPFYLNSDQTFHVEPRVGLFRYELRNQITSADISQEYIELNGGYQLFQFPFGNTSRLMGMGFNLRLGARYIFSGTESGKLQGLIGCGVLLKF